jgi:hypothetical protein
LTPFYGATIAVWTATATTTATLTIQTGQTGGTLGYLTAVCGAYSGSARTPEIDQVTVNTANTDQEPSYWSSGYGATTISPTEMLVGIFAGGPNETTLSGGGQFWSAGNVLLGSANVRQQEADGEAAGTATILQDYSVTSIGSYQSTWPPLDAYGAAFLITLR